MKIVIASGNRHKIEEMRQILQSTVGDEIELVSLGDLGVPCDIEENGETFEENALIKARYAARYADIAVADDSGLCVDALGGAPGVYSARYAGQPANYERNNEKLLRELEGVPGARRTAKFVSVIALVFSKEKAEFTVRGECPGRILEEYRGHQGFGYDPLFFYEEKGKTFAELSAEEKNLVSHRARSMSAFTELLKTKLKEYGYTIC